MRPSFLAVSPVSPLSVDQAEALLLAAVLRREPRPFAELLRRYRGLLFRCIGRITSRYGGVLGSDDVEEIFAEVCMALWADDLRRLRAFDANRGCKLGSWLGLIATHATYDFLRRIARRPRHEELNEAIEQVSAGPTGFDQVLASERRGALDRLTSELTQRDREFFAHYFRGQEEADDVARDLGISVKTVYSKKNKITKRLLRRAAETAIAM